MASASTTTNTELPRQSSICSLSTFIADLQNQNHLHNHPRNSGEFHGGEDDEASSMDDLLKNIYSDPPQQPPPVGVDEVWKRIVAGEVDQSTGVGGDAAAAMTLEDFLTKNGAGREEDVRVSVDGGGGVVGGGFGQFQGDQMVVYGGNGGGATAAVGRGKRRAVEEPLDKATQQKQRRMIKNRESAARSRERKQAYTVELEALVTQLEEENARLLRDEARRNQERYKQLMENLIPVVESKEKKMAERFNLGMQVKEEKMMENSVPEAGKNVTRVVLRRVCSMEW